MPNSFDKSISLGLGLLLYSREKVEELVEELVDKGEVARKDARQFAGELVQRGEEERAELKKLVQGEVTVVLERLNMAMKDDFVTKNEIREIVNEQIQQALREQEYLKSKEAR